MERTRWYKDAVVYQIYTRSFCDSNGDGIGDIRGIISKLDYISSLGVGAVWLNPLYKSPDADNGYDISDYRDITAHAGTLADWKELADGLHSRGIKLIMDFVFNSTSDEHPWFIESRKSKDNPYSDYYIWRKGKDDNGKIPPNNWTSNFFGKAWKYDKTTDEWYLHTFHEKQTELNWENPKVRKEISDIVNYWLDLGVDGFRCDVINLFSKIYNPDGSLPDGEKRFGNFAVGSEKYTNGPRIHEFIHEMYADGWGARDAMTVGEFCGADTPDETIHNFIDEPREELDMVYTSDHMSCDLLFGIFPLKKNNLVFYKKQIDKWQSVTAGAENWMATNCENHDQPRAVSHFMPRYGSHRFEAAKALALSYFFLRGTPFIFQGQELGMVNHKYKSTSELKDCSAINVMHQFRYVPGAKSVILWWLNRRGRDIVRTPVQWNDGENAGFTAGTPWLPVNDDYKTVNAAAEEKDGDSVLNFYKKLISIRKGALKDLVRDGVYRDLSPEDKNLFVYERKSANESLLIVTNFKDKKINFVLPAAYVGKQAETVVSVYPDSPMSSRELRPFEAAAYLVKNE